MLHGYCNIAADILLELNQYGGNSSRETTTTAYSFAMHTMPISRPKYMGHGQVREDV
jgi:hypothetical protein